MMTTSHTTQQHAYSLRQQETVLKWWGVFKSHQVGFSPTDVLTKTKIKVMSMQLACLWHSISANPAPPPYEKRQKRQKKTTQKTPKSKSEIQKRLLWKIAQKHEGKVVYASNFWTTQGNFILFHIIFKKIMAKKLQHYPRRGRRTKEKNTHKRVFERGKKEKHHPPKKKGYFLCLLI